MRGTGLCRRRDPRDPSRLGTVLNRTVSVEEMREAMQARRRPYDPVSVVLGRVARDLAESGAVDPELALSFVLDPTPALLDAVGAKASQGLAEANSRARF